MHPRCSTPERACSHHIFKGVPGSYAVRSQLMSYTPIQIEKQRVRRAMMKMKTEFKK
jgi:hypothetical protein